MKRNNPNRIVQHDHSLGATYSNCIGCIADERDKLLELVAEARELIGYAAESSTVTTSDDPGCFWCDCEEHRKKCKAGDWLARTAPKEAT